MLGVPHVPRFRPGLNFTNPNLVVDKNRQQTGRPFKQLTTSSSQTSKRANMKKAMLKISTSKKKGFHLWGSKDFFSVNLCVCVLRSFLQGKTYLPSRRRLGKLQAQTEIPWSERSEHMEDIYIYKSNHRLIES